MQNACQKTRRPEVRTVKTRRQDTPREMNQEQNNWGRGAFSLLVKAALYKLQTKTNFKQRIQEVGDRDKSPNKASRDSPVDGIN
jgi:hypothetical protein